MKFSLLLFPLLIFYSCHCSKSISQIQIPSADTSEVIHPVGAVTADPGQCSITATFLTRIMRDPSSTPTDSLPYVPVQIHINNVSQRGAGFTANINAGDKLIVMFAGKLVSGLKAGDEFEAGMEARLNAGGGYNYYIYDFKKMK